MGCSARRSPRRSAAWSFLAIGAHWGQLAATSGAAPVAPDHRLESLRIASSDGTELLPLPGTNRVLVFERTGAVRAVVGSEAASTTVALVPVDSTCPEHGVLAATWDPSAVGAVAFVAYTASRNQALSIGRLDLAASTFEEIYNHRAVAPCTNVGGGLAFGPDGMLYLGVGDFGQPSRAASGTTNVGKIYRMTTSGQPPAAPDVPNPIPNSFVYATGLRDPVSITASGPDVWFLDRGPGDEDELGLLVAAGAYGWSAAEQMGPQGVAGIEDPYYTWSPAPGVRDLEVDPAGKLGPALRGTLIVAADAGAWSVRPDRSDRASSTATQLVEAGPGDPSDFDGVAFLPDQHAYFTGPAGVHRLVPAGGLPVEPSRVDSIVPLFVSKLTGGRIELAVERVPGASETGLHVGSLDLLPTDYGHDDAPPAYLATDAGEDDAWTRHVLPADAIGGAGSDAYVLASARRNCIESGLGSGTFDVRPVAASPCTIDVLGGGTHDVAAVEVTVVADVSAQFNLPRDLAFHPDVPGELWVANYDSSVVVIHDTGLPTQWTTRHSGPGGEHFFPRASALAFGPGTGFLATIHEEDDYTQGPPPAGTPQDFMGPTLWIADSAVFDAGHATHYDMLHNTPNGMGIAWERANAYWVYDGYHESITRYDFNDHHGPGGSDHSDAIVTRYVEGEVGYAPDVGSHVQHDPVSGLVYAADTANGRIVVLDPATGTDGGNIFPNYDGCSQRARVGATLTTLVQGSDVGMVAPSGLELHDGLLFVSDNATSRIFAFDLAGGLVDYLDTGFTPGTLMGMAFDPGDGSLCVVDTVLDRVLRIRAR